MPPKAAGRKARAAQLLGSDAYLATNKPRRVASGKKPPGGPLLNCTSESRRRAADDTAAAAQAAPPARVAASPPPRTRAADAASVAVAAAAAAAAARLGVDAVRAACWALIAGAACRWWVIPRYFLFLVRPAPPAAAPPAAATPPSELAACWNGRPERAPPLPLPDLPPSLVDVEEPWMVEAKLPSRWPVRERRFLKRCRDEFRDQFARAPPYVDVYGDRRLLRVFRMDPERDEDKAVAKVAEYLRWREATGADAMRRLVPSIGPYPAKWPHGDVMLDCIRLLQCSDAYYDKMGNAVTCYQAFHWPAADLKRHLCGLGTAQLVEFVTFAAEYNASQMEKISLAREAVVLADAKRRFDERRKNGEDVRDPPLLREGWGEITRLCAITDMAGCTLGSVMMPTLIPAVIQSVSVFLNYYPYIVGQLHVINCQSTIARVFRRALVSVLPEHVASQIQIHSDFTNLFRSIARDSLPVQVGGDAPCAELVPPPPPGAHRRSPPPPGGA